MKPPRPPKQFKYPQLWWQPIYRGCFGRMRILYPNGKTEWSWGVLSEAWEHYPCCWNPRRKFKGNDMIKAMNDYDKERGFPRAIFLGEIK